MSTSSHFAELVVPGHATLDAAWAITLLHARAFLAGDSANTDFHIMNFSPAVEL
jgi:hypothetical protein